MEATRDSSASLLGENAFFKNQSGKVGKSVLNLLGYRTPNWKVALAEFVKSEF